MTNTTKQPGTDDFTFGFLLFLAVVVTLTATAISVITAIALLVIAWFFGQPRWTAFAALGGAAAAVAVQPLVPGFVAFVDTAFIAYRDASQHKHYIVDVAIEWLRFAFNPEAWLRLMPIGLILGAVCLLAIETQRASVIRKVFGGERTARPSPWAKIKIRRALDGPPLHRGAFVFGADEITGERITITRSQMNLHLFVVGRSGRGKTEDVLTLCTGAAMLGIPVFYIDGKGDPAVQAALRELATTHNRPFYAFDSVNPELSSAWDVFANMNPTTQADVVMDMRRYTEPHFEGKAGEFAGVVTKVHHHVGVPLDLVGFRRALSVDYLLTLLRRNISKEDNEGQELLKTVAALRKIEAEAVDSLTSEIGRLTDAVFGYLFDIERAKREGRQILRLLQARKERAIVYIGLPALEYRKLARKVGALGLSSLSAILPALDREHSARSKKPLPLEDKQVFYVCDEISVFAGDQVLNVVNQGRSYGGSCCLLGQSYADYLENGDDRLLRQVVASTNTFIVHELNDAQDAEYAASVFATLDSVAYTAQTVMGAPTDASSASARATKTFAAHPDEIKNLDVGEAFYVDKSVKDKKTNKSIVRMIKVRKSTR